MNIVEQIKGWIERDKSVKRVAEDLQLTSELVLLVRMIFADGELKSEELRDFKQICRIAFDIPEDDVPKVLKYLQEFGYETTPEDAASMFRNLEMDRKKALLVHMLSIAKADKVIHQDEADLIRKTASILGLGADDFEALQGGV